MLVKIFSIIILFALIAFLVFQVALLVRDIVKRKKSKEVIDNNNLEE